MADTPQNGPETTETTKEEVVEPRPRDRKRSLAIVAKSHTPKAVPGHRNTSVQLRKSAQRKIKQLEKKATEHRNIAHVAKQQAYKAKESFKTLQSALAGKGPAIISEDVLKETSVTAHKVAKENIIFEPNAGPQTEFLAASEKEVFYGGARGGGKSIALLIDPLRYANHPLSSALLIRRTMPELSDLIYESKRLYPKIYPGAKFKEQDKTWEFPTGGRMLFGYAENLTDLLRYQGKQYSHIGVDELPQFPNPDVWHNLRGSLRTVANDLPTFMRASGNPGNIGSGWVKEMFIDPAPAGQAFEVEVDIAGIKKTFTRRFIPAKLADNPHLLKNEDYLIALAGLPEAKRKQWLEGDWGLQENAAFPEFRRTTHVVAPFDIPRSWVRFRSCDWGYATWACVLWFAIDFNNDLYIYRELYTKGMAPDKFAQKVIELEAKDPKPIRGIMDSSVWARRGDIGPPIPETMRVNGCNWSPSDRSPGSRIAGKMELHRRLATNERTTKPRLQIFSNCVNLVRTIEVLPLELQDGRPLEDVDTKAEDHAYDALRYGAMSRPMSGLHHIYQTFADNTSRHGAADSVFGY